MNWLPILVEWLGSLVLLLHGWERFGSAFQGMFGGGLDRQLTRPITVMVKSAMASAFLHSSTVTTIMAIGFVTTGLMTLSHAIWVLLAAEVGSALAVQVLAFPLWGLGPGMLVAGFLMATLFWRTGLRQAGHLLIGMGLSFWGLHLMDGTVATFTLWPGHTTLLQPLLILPAALLLTALTQSLIAATAMALVLAHRELLTLELAGIWVAGGLMGTCLNALWAMRGKPPEGQRVGLAHILLRGTIALSALLLLPQLTQVVAWLSLSGMPVNGLASPHQVAHWLALLAMGGGLLWLPLAHPLVLLCQRLLPNPEATWSTPPETINSHAHTDYLPKYLDDTLLDSPSLAIGMVRRETREMADILGRMIAGLPEAVHRGDLKKMARLRRMDDQVDAIHQAITRYLSHLDIPSLNPQQTETLLAVAGAVDDLESMGDIIENNLYHLAEVRVEQRVILSEEDVGRLNLLHQAVYQAYRLAVNAFVTDNPILAQQVIAMKELVNHLDGECRRQSMTTMHGGGETPNLVAFSLQSDLRENLKRLYYHAKRIAKAISQSEEPPEAAL